MTEEEQLQLIESCDFLNHYSYRMSVRCGHRVPAEDLRQYAILGLLKCAARHGEVKFPRAVAWGSMVDAVRKETHSRFSTGNWPALFVSLDLLDNVLQDEHNSPEAIERNLCLQEALDRMYTGNKRLHSIMELRRSGFTLKEIADGLGLHISRVSQIEQAGIEAGRAMAAAA